jgi:ammonium transporter, Amt family
LNFTPNKIMKRILLMLALIATAAFGTFSACADDTATNTPAAAPAAPPPLPAASTEQRLESLEAYISNGDPTAPLKDTNGNLAVTSPIINTGMQNSTGATVNYPGAGHNAWLLASTALVLFMTLPGLALFYGGLVRKKNVLSVLAQCFLITGLTTILWYICSYGMIFGGTGAADKEDLIKAVVGSPKICWMFLPHRTRIIPIGFRKTCFQCSN